MRIQYFEDDWEKTFKNPIAHGWSLRVPDFTQSDEELLAECEVDVFCASGPGGQNVNRRETAVRLRHRPSGLVVHCHRERSQYRNKLLALEELRRRLARLAHRRRPRIPTRKSAGARARGRVAKEAQGEKKVQRRKPTRDE